MAKTNTTKTQIIKNNNSPYNETKDEVIMSKDRLHVMSYILTFMGHKCLYQLVVAFQL